MDDPWKLLQLAAIEAIGPLWNEFAKEGRESAVLAPMARYPTASAWLARSMSLSTDCITRKLAAMLAGWIQDPKQISMLREMLERERTLFREDSLSANSVGEDIMFAATRWTRSQDDRVRVAGIDILSCMVNDALKGTHWNTVHWAVANLNRATNGSDPIFERLTSLTEEQLTGQRHFQNAIKAVQQNDVATLNRFVTLPSDEQSLPLSDPNYATVASLWTAAASAEAATRLDH
jgi:hypothetical protein